MRQHITPFRTALMFTLTLLASTPFVLVVTGSLGAVLALRKSGYWVGRLALSVPVCMLINELLKRLFHRVRPVLADPLVKLQTYSFPSGHALSATVLYGFGAILLWSCITSKIWRVAISIVVVAVILAVGLSRVYLGAHYPTDVLGGMLEGVAWLSFAAMIANSDRPHLQGKSSSGEHSSLGEGTAKRV